MKILLKPRAEDYRTSMIQRCNAAIDACEDSSPTYNHWKKVKRFVLKECGDIETAKRFSAILSGMNKKKVEEYMDSRMLECCNIENIEFTDVVDTLDGFEGISVYVVMKDGEVYRNSAPKVPEFDSDRNQLPDVSEEMKRYMKKRIYWAILSELDWKGKISRSEHEYWSNKFEEVSDNEPTP